MPDQIPFDYLGAKKAGYSDEEIKKHLKSTFNFDFDIIGAKKSGYSDKEIADYIYAAPTPEKKNLGGTPSSVGGGRFPSVSEVLSTSNGKVKDENKWVKAQPASISEGVKKDKKKDDSVIGGLYNTIVGSVSRLVGGIGQAAQSLGKSFVPHSDILPIPDIRKPMAEFVEKARTGSSSKENEQNRSQFDITNGVQASDVKALLFQAPSQILDMVGGALTYGTSFFLQAANDAAKELEETPDADKLTDGQKAAYVYLNGTIQGGLDYLPVFKVLKSTGLSQKVKQKIANEIVDEAVKKGVKLTAADIEKETLKKAASFAMKVKKVGLKATTGFAYEAPTEALQQAGSDATKLLANKVAKHEIFDEEDITTNFIKNALNAGVQGGVFGVAFGGGSSVMTNTNKAIRNELAKAQTPEDVQNIQQQIAEQVELGNITEEEAQAANITAQQYAEIAAKIPQEVDAEKKYAIIGGIEQRENLKKEIQKATEELSGIDPAFHAEKNPQIELLQAKLEQTNDYIEGLVAGKKPTYRKEGEEFIKTSPDGTETKITKEHYELAVAVREEEANKNKQAATQPTGEGEAATVKTKEEGEGSGKKYFAKGGNSPEVKTHNIDTAKSLLSDLGVDASFSGYSDTNGVSVYFTDSNGKKIRVSNHSVTNKDRMANEVLLYFDTKTLGLGGKEGFKSYAEQNKKEVEQSIPTKSKATVKEGEGAKVIMPEENKKPDIIPLKKATNETTQEPTKANEPIPTEEKSQPEKGTSETPPPAEPPKGENKNEGGSKLSDKALLNRLFNSDNISESGKDKFKTKLKYPVASKEEARVVAKGIIEEFGIEEAVAMAEGRRFYRGVNSAIFAEALDSLYTQEKAAKSKGALANETTLALADQWSDVVLRYDEWLRDFGTEISFVADFYKKSPLGVKLTERKKRDASFSEWFDKREKNYKEVFEELQKDAEFEKFFKEKVKEELKKERAEVRKARIEKVDKFFDDAKKKVEGEGGALYATIIPPKIMSIAIDGMKKAYHGGEKIAELIQEAVDYISEQMGNAPWDKEKFRKEWEEKLKDRLTDEELYQSNLRKQIKELDEQIINLKRKPPKEKTKKQWSDETKKLIEERDAKKKELNEKVPKISIEEKQKAFLEKWAKKLEGLSQKEKAEVIRRSFKEIVENKVLKYDKFKNIIADVLGLGELKEADSAKMEKYVEDMNALDDFENKALEAKTDAEKRKAIKEYDKAHEKAERSATDLAAILYNKPDIVNRLATIMQLKTLTATSLLKNPVYNIAFQATQRFWVASTLSVLDQAIYQGSKVANKTFGTKVVQPDYNVIASQRYYWEKMSKGWQVAIKQLFTGTTSRDYFQKEIYSQQIKPAKSWRDLIKSKRGELHLSGEQKLDKILQGTIGVEAEIVARLLNIGDKPFRFGAEAAAASIEAGRLGLKGADKELFMAFPKKMAYNAFKKKGLSDEKAQEKAEIVEKRIIREGEQAVFQQENVVSKLLTGFGQLTDTVLGGEDPVSKTFKGLSTIVGKAAMPFKKVPLNAAWELINVVVPELALAQSVVFATKAGIAKSKGQESARLDYISAKKWLATAIVGIGLQVVTNWLFKIGAISGQDDDEDKKERDAEKLYTRPNSINLTKVLRVVGGGSSDSQEGDLLIDGSWFGNVGIMANIQNNIREDMTPEEKEKLFTLFNDLLGRMDLAANEAIDNGIFSTSLALLKAYSDRNTGFGNNVLMNMINTGTNIAQSGTFAQWSRAQIPYEYRLKADTFWEQLHNNMAARSGLYRTFTGHYPPARISIWGEKMDRENPVFMQQLGMKKNNKDNFAQPIWDDYEKSHNLKLWPPSVPKVITVNGERKKLNVGQQDKLQEFVGKQRQDLLAPFVNGLATIIDEEGNEVKFSEIKNEKLKIKLLQKIYKQGYKQGKILFQLANPDFMPQNPENIGEDEPEDG